MYCVGWENLTVPHSKTKWAIPEKIQTPAGVEDMEFPGVLKKEHVEIPEVN